ncbi:Dehydrogenase patE [Penicillium capsulatum]|uniref:Dehydrogenase patE n=1 Tax=Penicillium capsulatum TaxID=69766 RepID=A0A9W9LZY1_9EURO|nr:Dehydrogenase patE [Penicillium capsulatum]KAJ6129436.1 Dehydrogenase patE [Penicillium capsulatum]
MHVSPFAGMLSILGAGKLQTAVFVAFIGIFAYQAWNPFNTTFDYVVVGGGTAGITVGARLVQHGFRVAVVEAGGYYETKRPLCRVPGAATIGTGASPSVASGVDWKFVAHQVPGADYRDIHYPRGKCMGGSSALNFMIYQRPSKDTMSRWAEVVEDSSYLFENVLPFFKKTVSFTPPNPEYRSVRTLYNQSSFDKNGQPLEVSYPKFAMPFSDWVRKALIDTGLPETQDFNSGFLMGHQFCSMTIRPQDQSRSSSEAAFFQSSQNTSDLAVYQKTLAKRILFDGKNKATGVRIKGTWESTLTATREVIVTAGAFQSPQLLMVSGVGPADILQRYGIKVIADLPGVGQNMWDHVFFGPSYQVTVSTFSSMIHSKCQFLQQAFSYVFLKNGALTNPSADYLAFEKIPQRLRSTWPAETEQDLSWYPQDWPEVEYLAASAFVGNFSNPVAQQPRGEFGSIISSLVAPTSRGNVTISSADTADLPIINPNWLSTDTDQNVAIASYRRIREMFHSKAIAPVIVGSEYFPGPQVKTDSEILDIIKKTVMTIYHAACTCKMGVSSDRMAVVDSRARVFGVSGLRVVDASAFPILPPGHPQSVVYMLAEKIAADIIAS